MKGVIKRIAGVALFSLAAKYGYAGDGLAQKADEAYEPKAKLTYSLADEDITSSRKGIMQATGEMLEQSLAEEPIMLADTRESRTPSRISAVADEAGKVQVEVELFRYTGGPTRELFWGVTRPVHLWNHGKNGKLKILPFYLSTDGIGGTLYGGLVAAPVNFVGNLIWDEKPLRNPIAENPALHAGQALDLLVGAAAAASSGGGGSSATSTDNGTGSGSTGSGSGSSGASGASGSSGTGGSAGSSGSW